MRSLPGKPDIVFPRAKVAVFCDGDFWHGRHWPALKEKLSHGANSSYWIAKIDANRRRDRRVRRALSRDGWRTLKIWETDVLKNPSRAAERIHQAVAPVLP